jgi:cephalosporin hydroxylase
MSPEPRTDLAGKVRSAVTGRLDPLVQRRAATLASRRLRGVPLQAQVGTAADASRRALFADLNAGLKADTLGAAERAEVATLMRSYLQTLDSDVPREDVAAVCAAFEGLVQPTGQPVPQPAEPITRTITDSFHRLYYNVSRRTWKDTWYRGVLTYKCPTDMWIYQELINDLKPSLVVETGTFRGGSALFIADRLETLGHGEVITIDIDVQPDRPEHPRLTYLTGSSVGDAELAEVRKRIPADGHVLVILDADHSQRHVAAELKAYAPLVTVGSYLVVEDTNVNGHPTAPQHGPGPWEAVEEFLATDPGFEVDERCERYFLTQNPRGYLRKVR